MCLYMRGLLFLTAALASVAQMVGAGDVHRPGMPLDGPVSALHRPLVRSLFSAFLLPELQTELGLTADQATRLRNEKTNLLARENDLTIRIDAKQNDLDCLFAPDTSKGQQVKVLLEQISELRAQQVYAVYTSSRAMKGILTPDQRTRVEAWKPEELRHAVMSHLTLEDFSKAASILIPGF